MSALAPTLPAFAPDAANGAARDLLQTFLDSLGSDHSRRAYAQGAQQFFAWAHAHAPGAAFSRALVLQYRAHLQDRGLAASTINVQLAALRSLAREAAEAGCLTDSAAHGIQAVRGFARRGNRAGSWLTARQTRQLLSQINRSTLRGKRDYALCALLFGCGLRRSEAAQLDVQQLQLRENRWVIADLLGKAGRVRTLPIHEAVKESIDDWLQYSDIRKGKVFRQVLKNQKVLGEGLSPEAVLQILQHYSQQIQMQGIDFPLIKPHDARRTYAKLCRKTGAKLEEIQQNLGHASLTTTEKYLGEEFNLEDSINDKLDLFQQ